ncbi:MAG: radical SAM protein [Pseudomonadota bacterium]
MRVLFISANTETVNMRTLPWGLWCVAAAARKAGHDVSVLDLMTQKNPGAAAAKAVKKADPQVIGISVRNIDDQNMRSPAFLLEKVKQVVAGCRKASDATLVLGGAGYSIFPESALEFLGADMGIQGEGEQAFTVLLDRLSSGADLSDVPGLHLPGRGLQGKRNFAPDLDAFPCPDEDILASCRPDENLWLPVQSRRGCFMNCSYCSTALIEGRELRQRSARLVVECLEKCSRLGFSRVFFVDNNFNIPKPYAIEMCRELAGAKLGMTWRCILNPHNADDDLVKAMAGAGCGEVSLGFESGSADILRQMRKKFSLEDIRRTAGLLAGHGIRRMGFLLLGGPGETRLSIEESLAFADSLKLDAVRVTIGIRIYPHTRLAATAKSEGVITPRDDLLYPRFYLAPGLDDWIQENLPHWKAARPHWIF